MSKIRKKLFLWGLSGAGKDTVSNYLRDYRSFMKIRIAHTIKNYVFETNGFKTQKNFETYKRTARAIRRQHNVFGNQYDKEGIRLSNNLSSLNRLRQIIDMETFEFEIVSDLRDYDIVVSDVRTIDEVKLLLESGYTGIFLTRNSSEYADKTHKTEQSILSNGELSKFLSENPKYSDQIKIIDNQTTNQHLKLDNFENVYYRKIESNNVDWLFETVTDVLVNHL